MIERGDSFQLQPVQIDAELAEELMEFRAEHDYETEAELMRDLLRRGMRERKLALLLYAVEYTSLPRELIAETMSFHIRAWIESLGEILSQDLAESDFDFLEVVGGSGELNDREIEALFRIQGGTQDHGDVRIFFSQILPKIDGEVFLEQLFHSDSFEQWPELAELAQEYRESGEEEVKSSNG